MTKYRVTGFLIARCFCDCPDCGGHFKHFDVDRVTEAVSTDEAKENAEFSTVEHETDMYVEDFKTDWRDMVIVPAPEDMLMRELNAPQLPGLERAEAGR